MNENYKNRLYKWGAAAVLVLTVFLAVETVGALKGLGEVDPAFNSISVVGEGEVVVIPDVATFSFAVSAEAGTVSAAQEQVTTKMNAILTALEERGIEERDIKTTNYSVYPRYSYAQGVCGPNYCPPSRQVLEGYTATHNIDLKVRETDKAGEVLASVGDLGATNISGISFTTDDPDMAYEEARAQAIRDARDKAKQLADELDVRLVRVVSYYDNTNNGPRPLYGMGGEDMAFKQEVASAPSIPQGENKVEVSVTVTYEIR